MATEDFFKDILDWEENCLVRFQNIIDPTPSRESLLQAVEAAINKTIDNPSYLKTLKPDNKRLIKALLRAKILKYYLASLSCSDEDILAVADIALAAFEFGWSCGEIVPADDRDALLPYAETRIKMINNQPPTRKRSEESKAKEDIESELQEYVHQKGHPPINHTEFLKFIRQQNEYIVDDENETVIGQAWKKPRSFSTINKWRNAWTPKE